MLLRVSQIAAELVHNKGKAAVEELQVTVEREWLQLKTIRRRFNGGSSPVLVRHCLRDYRIESCRVGDFT